MEHALKEYVQQGLSTSAMLFDFGMIEKMDKLANMMATSKIAVPVHFRNSPGDCLAVVMQSAQWGMNPYAIAQKCFNINGVLGYEAQLVNAVITARAPITKRLEYEWFGEWEKIVGKFKTVESKTKKDDHGKFKTYVVPDWESKDEAGLGIRVWTTLKGEEAPRELTLLMTQARTRNSTLWTEDPKQQLAYLATKRWARLYCPDVIMGVYTPDELEESIPVFEKEINPIETSDSKTDAVLNKLKKKQPPVANVVTLDEVMKAIATATGRETLFQAKELMFALATKDLAVAEAAYKNKVEQLKKSHGNQQQPHPEPVNWETSIKECRDSETLTALLADMPESYQIELNQQIDEQFDSFR